MAFAAALLLSRRRKRGATLAMVVLSLAATARYLYWRISTTIGGEWSVDAVLGGILLLAELYACAMLVLAYWQSIAGLKRKPLPMPDDVAHWPSVDVYIPTYNEPLDVVRATVYAALAIDWPKDRLHVYLLDDGRRTAFRDFAREVGAGYVTRPTTSTPRRATSTTPCASPPANTSPSSTATTCRRARSCRSPWAGCCATRASPWCRRRTTSIRRIRTAGTCAPRASPRSELFYGVIQPGLDTWNATFFCGSCAVLRRKALEEVSGIAVETVTEDAHTALKLHRRGWRTAYLAVPQAAGLETETLAAHVGQRIRWARGMAQIFRVDNPLFGRGLKPAQRFCYLAAMLHFFSGIPRLVFLVAPVAYLVFGRHVFNALPLAAVAYGLPHLLHSTATNARIHGKFRHSFWSEVYEACLAWYTAIPTTVALFAPRAGKFNVTAKGGRIDEPRFDARIARPAMLLAAVNLAAITAGCLRMWHGNGELDSLAINVAWAVHNLVILSAAIAVACERPQVRGSQRVPLRLPAMLRFADGTTMRCETRDLGRAGAGVVLPAKLRAGQRDRVWLSIFSFGEERALSARVVECTGDVARVRFDPLSVDEEAHLVRAIFSRADAWLGWTRGHRRDRPLRTLASIAGPASPASAGPSRSAHALLGPRASSSGASRELGRAARRRAVRQRGAGRGAHADPGSHARAARLQRGRARISLHRARRRAADRGHRAARLRPRPAGSRRARGAGERRAPRRAHRQSAHRRPRAARAPRAAGRSQHAHAPAARCRRPLHRAPRGLPRAAVRRRGAQGQPGAAPRRALALAAAVLRPRLRRRRHRAGGLRAAADSGRRGLAAIIAGWFAVSAPIPLTFEAHVGALPESRAIVLIGSAADAQALGIAPLDGPLIRVVNHPRHPASNVKLLVIGGRTQEELRVAAEALAVRSTQLAGQELRLLRAKTPPLAAPYSAPRWVPSEREVHFSEYPEGGTLIHEGNKPATLSVRFRVAPDLWIWPRDLVTLDLGWSERVPQGTPAPRLDVELNGFFLATLPSGKAHGRVRLHIPREHMRGFNELLVHVHYPEPDPCAPIALSQGDPPRVAIDGTSVLHLEGLQHYADLPDVSLFAFDGFPFSRVPISRRWRWCCPRGPPCPSSRWCSQSWGSLRRRAGASGRARRSSPRRRTTGGWPTATCWWWGRAGTIRCSRAGPSRSPSTRPGDTCARACPCSTCSAAPRRSSTPAPPTR